MTRLTLASFVHGDEARRVPCAALGQLRLIPSPVHPYLTKSLVQCHASSLPLSEVSQKVMMTLNAACLIFAPLVSMHYDGPYALPAV